MANQSFQNESERPVDALAVKKYQSLTHLMTTSNPEMLAHLKYPSVMEVALRYKLLTLFPLLILFKLLYTA